MYIRLSKISVTNFQPEKANDPSNLSATFSIYTKTQTYYGTPDLILHYFDPLNELRCLSWNGPSIQSVNVQPLTETTQGTTGSFSGTATMDVSIRSTPISTDDKNSVLRLASYPVQSIYA
jgi:hypothetical protein